jgi:hypothetical protein
MEAPLVSVLIPAFRAEDRVQACLQALLGGENASVPTELLVESDDGADYAAAAALSPRVSVGRSGQVRSGVGAARGRALARTRAPFVTYVDADDIVSPDYLPRLLQAAQQGAAAAVTRVVENGAEVARFGVPGERLDFAALGRHGASFRGLFSRDMMPRFENDLSQDILHMAEVLLRLGPIPMTAAVYDLHLATGTVTAATDFSARVDEAYQRHIARLGLAYAGHAALTAAQGVFEAKRALNCRFIEEAEPGESYYAFIARQFPGDGCITHPPGAS